jgi:hypothetical protein|tara:strand:+ start:755 stop:943 length:189 start_codon:yes stop_codon:yes gene_type:complete
MIQTVKKNYITSNFNETIDTNMYIVTYDNGTVLQVPHNEANRHYQEILEWVAAGNTITDPGA